MFPMLLRCFLTGLLGMFFMFSTPAAERVEVFNLGVPGLPGTLFKGERLRKVIGGKPDLAVLMFGTNDAVNSSILSSEAAFESVMTASIGEMCRSGIKVILVNLPPCEEALVFERHPKEKYQQLPPNARIRSLNAILQRIAGKHGIPLVDFYSEAARKGTTGAASLIRNPRNGGGRDGIHLTPEGYRILAELIFKAVAKLNFKQGRIFCIGDSITYGAGVQGGGTVTGDTYPARLRECFQKAVPKIGFWTEELIYGEMWRKYGLYDMLKQNGFLANAENTMDFIFGKISEDEIFRRLSQYHCVVISLERGYHSYDYAATTRHYRNALRGVEQRKEFHPEGDVFEHTMRMLSHMVYPSSPELGWSILLHDAGKPACRGIREDGRVHFYAHEEKGAEIAEAVMRRLKMPGKMSERIVSAVRNHMRFAQIDKMRTAKWRRLAAEENFPLELELHRIDCISCHGKLNNYLLMLDRLHALETAHAEAVPQPFLRGGDILALGVPPGPKVGFLLKYAADLQLDGIVTTREDALNAVKNRLIHPADL